jgi:hypothetical protein
MATKRRSRIRSGGVGTLVVVCQHGFQVLVDKALQTRALAGLRGGGRIVGIRQQQHRQQPNT